jgi:3-hydroxybutyryl-CoA dehydrogenase
MAEIETVGVVGAGTMGSGIAHVFARSGFRVLLHDVEQRFLDRALDHIRTNLARESVKGKLPQSEIEPALARIYATTDRSALAGAEFAIEAVPERFELKINILRALDEMLPVDAILATNTSSISITRLAAATERPTHVIGMHFFNPVPVMALVEVVRGLETSQSAFATVY